MYIYLLKSNELNSCVLDISLLTYFYNRELTFPNKNTYEIFKI